METFTEFEQKGWQRVADKYDAGWSGATRQFVQPLLDMAEVGENMSVLDLGCGPGYVSAGAKERGAVPVGLDFCQQMIGIAKRLFPGIEFREGDAQKLPFADATFDRVVSSFALLHFAAPERAFAEACRVLKPSGKFGFSTSAQLGENPFVKLVQDAIRAHANMDVGLPEGPPHYLFDNPEEFRKALERAGFDGASMTFKLHTIDWKLPSARFIFDLQLNASVRTGGRLRRQRPETLRAIESAIEEAIRPYAQGDGFVIPKSAYIVVVRKS
jgi:ubiquinone/menaquinone biosynthesis C-methylase UbiE